MIDSGLGLYSNKWYHEQGYEVAVKVDLEEHTCARAKRAAITIDRASVQAAAAAHRARAGRQAGSRSVNRYLRKPAWAAARVAEAARLHVVESCTRTGQAVYQVAYIRREKSKP